jgi:hypothetical protein
MQLTEAWAGQSMCITKFIHNFRDLPRISPGDRSGELVTNTRVGCCDVVPGYHRRDVIQGRVDRLIRTVEICVDNTGRAHARTQVVQRNVTSASNTGLEIAGQARLAPLAAFRSCSQDSWLEAS